MAKKPAGEDQGFENMDFGGAGGDTTGAGSFDGEGLSTEDGEGFVVDMSNVGDANYTPIPVGVYNAEVHSLEFGKSQSSGNNMFTWVFAINDGSEYDGRRFWYHTTFTEGGLPRVKKTLAVIKCDDNYQETLTGKFSPQKVADEGRLLGARCRIRIGIQRYQGENRNNVRDVMEPAEGGGFAT